MDLLDTGPGCGSNTNGSSTAPAYLEVKDSYAELNGTWWKLCEAQGGYAPPMTIVSYLNSIHVRQLSAPGSPYGMRLNVSVSLRVGEWNLPFLPEVPGSIPGGVKVFRLCVWSSGFCHPGEDNYVAPLKLKRLRINGK
jgi:hypothetical protein